MALINCTAWVLGDPQARSVRQPTQAEIERTGRYEVAHPQSRKAWGQGKLSPTGIKVRAMKPGDVLVMPSYGVGNGFRSYMVREYGWTMRLRSVVVGPELRRVELTRLT